ncbi:porin family protein [Bradyrhizobium sp. 177]|uniref:outer membrane protein n=1 Tax=Bradyrhizobium sp. 177 TaxID=2782647 RepID=UPI001FF88FAB|nr:porin family protein [Bradyrhizobium sp. 177]
MRKLLLTAAGALALGLSAPASAADMAARPYTKAPPMVAAIYDWSGFYIGANAGWGSSRNSWDSVAPFLVGPEGSHDATGGVAGGQVGYRWQTGTWVFGLEAQGDWADLRGNNLSTLFGPGFRNDSRINAFGLFTGQLGWATNNVLFYVKGGAAVTDNRNRIYSTATGAVLATTGDDTRWGGTVGVGLEYGFAPGWSAGVEYDHLFMQDRTLTFTGPAGLAFGADRIRQDVDLVTVRVNYKFGGPSIGRY